MGLDSPVPPIWGSKLAITWSLSPVDDAAAWLVSITINAGEHIESSHQYAPLMRAEERKRRNWPDMETVDGERTSEGPWGTGLERVEVIRDSRGCSAGGTLE